MVGSSDHQGLLILVGKKRGPECILVDYRPRAQMVVYSPINESQFPVPLGRMIQTDGAYDVSACGHAMEDVPCLSDVFPGLAPCEMQREKFGGNSAGEHQSRSAEQAARKLRQGSMLRAD